MSEWTQVGKNIGGSSYDYSGKALSPSADGSIVAIGAYGHDKSGAPQTMDMCEFIKIYLDHGRN